MNLSIARNARLALIGLGSILAVATAFGSLTPDRSIFDVSIGSDVPFAHESPVETHHHAFLFDSTVGNGATFLDSYLNANGGWQHLEGKYTQKGSKAAADIGIDYNRSFDFTGTQCASFQYKGMKVAESQGAVAISGKLKAQLLEQSGGTTIRVKHEGTLAGLRVSTW